MARFTLKKRQKPSNGWKETQLRHAQEIAGENFDPQSITPEQYISELKDHWLKEISRPYTKD